MNKTIFMGRLTRDPETKYTEGDDPTTITKYTLAVDRRRKKGREEKADYIPCVAFRGAGDFAAKYFKKGMRVAVSGRLQTYTYLNAEGNNVHGFEIVVEEQEFADGKKSDNNPADDNSNYENGGAAISTESDIGDGFMNIPDEYEDGLPFN